MSRKKVCTYCGRIHKDSVMCRERKEAIQRMSKKRINDYKDNDNEHDKMMLEIYRFRNSGAWKKKREEIRVRDGGCCLYCLIHDHVLTVDELSVHHIIGLAQDFSLRLDESNLITLCSFHHELAEKGMIDKDELRGMVLQGIEI